MKRLILIRTLVGLAFSLLLGLAPVADAATITVQSATDDGTAVAGNCPGGGCRLCDALAVASAGDTIEFNGNYTITLASQLTLDKNLTIQGTGRKVTISGNHAVRVFSVNSGVTATLSHLTIANGNATDFASQGGGIANHGNLTVTNCTLLGNHASFGGGIANNNILTIANSTLSGNSAYEGGGILSYTLMTMTHCTLAGNQAYWAEGGGGICISVCTLNYNNNIIANNSGGDFRSNSAPVTPLYGNNLIGDGYTYAYAKFSGDPKLGPLADNGGDTQTFALMPGSPGIDAGNNGVGATTDQRGMPRPFNGICDLGAYERNDTTAPTVTNFMVTSPSSSLNIPIVYFNASDNERVAAYLITQSSTAPGYGDSGWSDTMPTIYVVGSAGTYLLYPWVKDGAGNVSALFGSPCTVVVDPTAPIVTVPANMTVEATNLFGAVVTFNASATDETAPANPVVSCVPASGNTFARGVTTPVTCSAFDNAGNVGSSTFTVTVQDTTAPIVTVPADATLEATGPSGAVYNFSASATDVVDIVSVSVCTPPSGSTFPLGTTTVTCTATDSSGNTGSGSFRVTVQDTIPPTVTVPANATIEATGPSGAVYTFTATATDLIAPPNPAVTCAPASGSMFPLGTTTVTCSATDTAGNSGSNTFTVTVQDTTAPTVTVPANATIEATGPTGAVHTFTATATDTVAPLTPAVTCAPASGSTFPLGATTVTCTATDTAGNSGSNTFSVTVQDTTAPTVTVPANATIEATGPTGAVHAFTATASDAADPAPSVSCTPPSGSVFALGTTTVTCTATDASGNSSSSGSFTVTVRDTTAPTVTVPANATIEATGPTGAGYTFSATATDLVAPLTPAVTCAPASGSTFPLGTTTVTCTATDTAGNTGNNAFTVKVQDTTAPTVSVTSLGTLDTTPPLSGTITDNTATATAIIKVTVNGKTYSATNNGNGTWTLADNTITPALALGVYNVTVTATDTFGNVGTDATTNELTIRGQVMLPTTPTAYDANKTGVDDQNLCWAAAAADLLAWGGWGTPTYNTAQAILANFTAHWTDAVGKMVNAWRWWLNGITPSIRETGAKVDVGGAGNYWANTAALNYAYLDATANMMNTLKTAITKGFGVTLGISNAAGASHALTVWGCEYDATLTPTAVYVTDSNDNAAQVLTLPVTLTAGKWSLVGGNYLNWTIQEVDAFGKQGGLTAQTVFGGTGAATGLNYAADTAVPEPASLLLVGVGLLGVIGLLRRRRS